MQLTKRERLIRRIENHLRITSRQLVKFDTEEETLQYLIDSFRQELLFDFVGIILKDDELLQLKVSSGISVDFAASFPLAVNKCSSELLQKSLTYDKVHESNHCAFSQLLSKEKIPTWFTLPLKDGDTTLGFCVIGFTTAVPLFVEMHNIFTEFGKDVAVAISLAKQKEAQKKKILGIEWLSKNLYFDSSIEHVVEKIVERAGKGTQAKSAYIYLYDEKENCFVFQPPAYGEFQLSQKISLENDYVLKNHFPYLEEPGGSQLTVPLVVNLKTIGVLHVEQKSEGTFTADDFQVLELLASHVAAILENARLYHNEKENKKQLQSVITFQQDMIKETVEHENFDGITKELSKQLATSVILFDRFMQPITHQLVNRTEESLEELAARCMQAVMQDKKYEFQVKLENKASYIRIWPVNGGGDLLGYLAIELPDEDLHEITRISIELSLNVYSVQFIKQKLVFDTREQVKDSFINKLLVKKIEDRDGIIQYASIFNWDLRKTYRIAALSISLDETVVNNNNIIEQQAVKTAIWEQIKLHVSHFDRDIIIAHKGDEYVFITPIEREGKRPNKYWEQIYQFIKKCLHKENMHGAVYIGIGGKAKEIEEYYQGYEQAVQALNVVLNRYSHVGYALFDDLGSYTLLHHLKDADVTDLFIKKHLTPLLEYSDRKSVDLFHTLRVFLANNGSIKDTSEQLFIHRSTLQYRIEKIQSLLELDLNNAEHRFNIMMAYKLYDLYYDHSV